MTDIFKGRLCIKKIKDIFYGRVKPFRHIPLSEERAAP